jgi:predicted DNA-binding transcriptional regulator AlpA
VLLTIRDLAAILQVPEPTVYHWMEQEQFPFFSLNGQPRADAAEVLAWLATHQVQPSPEAPVIGERDASSVRLDDALQIGVIARDVAGYDRCEVLAQVVGLIPPVPGLASADLLRLLQSESATSLVEGIAVPQLICGPTPPMLALCFLVQPVSWGVGGENVHTVCALLAPTAAVCRQLLSRIFVALEHPGFRDALRRRLPEWEILAAARAVEQTPEPAGTLSAAAER